MLGRPHAIRSLAGKAAIGAVVVPLLVLAACGSTSATGGSTPTAGTNPLTSCTVSASDLAPTTSNHGTATAVSGLSGQKITSDGSSALQPLIKQAAAEFDQASGTQSTINAGGSGQGLKDVEAGAVQIGNSDVFASTKAPTSNPHLYDNLTDHQVAAVVFTLVVNNDLKGKVGNLSSQQIQQIFTGQVTNWSQIGGPSEGITVVIRPTTSGTRATFDKYVMNGTAETAGSVAQAAAVAATPGSIGYISIGFAASAQYSNQVAPICIDGGKAVAADVNSGKYNFWAVEHAYTKGPATGAVKSLLTYVESSQVQQNDLLALSYLPISTVSQTAIQAHTPSGAPAPESFYGS
jgi:phosphate transport system substrate-binding protein